MLSRAAAASAYGTASRGQDWRVYTSRESAEVIGAGCGLPERPQRFLGIFTRPHCNVTDQRLRGRWAKRTWPYSAYAMPRRRSVTR